MAKRTKRPTKRPRKPVTATVVASPPPALRLVRTDAGVDHATPVLVQAAPKKVALVAMGATSAVYNSLVASHGHRKTLFDETWVINAMGSLMQFDRAFVMQDIATNIREESKERKVAQGILKWLPECTQPVYTTTAYPEWPALVEYPVQDVLRFLGGPPYLNNSVAYAIAYAMYIGVHELFLFGCDFTYTDNHISESGRGCCEYVIGIGVARGMKFAIPDSSTLLDANKPTERKLYGFADPMELSITDGQITVKRKERQPCTPTSSTSTSPPEQPQALALAR